MTSPLHELVKINHLKPPRIAVLGVGGIGKTTFCSNAPNPIFLQTEDGLGNLQVAALPLVETYDDFKNQLDMIVFDEHKYKTVVIDSATWLDHLIQLWVCRNAGKASMTDFGYGSGYDLCMEEWKILLQKLNLLVTRGCIPILIAHTQVTTFSDPVNGDFDRVTFRLHKKSAGLIEEWCDIILYADYDITVKREEKGFGAKKGRAKGEERIIYTEGKPSFVAKNRYGLPPTLPFNWSEFQSALKASFNLNTKNEE